jgi:acyl-CoA hydrolase
MAEEIPAARTMTAARALEAVKSGQHVVVGSGAAEPRKLVEALAERGAGLSDTEVLHLLTLGPAPWGGCATTRCSSAPTSARRWARAWPTTRPACSRRSRR